MHVGVAQSCGVILDDTLACGTPVSIVQIPYRNMESDDWHSQQHVDWVGEGNWAAFVPLSQRDLLLRTVDSYDMTGWHRNRKLERTADVAQLQRGLTYRMLELAPT